MTLEHIDRFSWIFWNYHFKSKENRVILKWYWWVISVIFAVIGHLWSISEKQMVRSHFSATSWRLLSLSTTWMACLGKSVIFLWLKTYMRLQLLTQMYLPHQWDSYHDCRADWILTYPQPQIVCVSKSGSHFNPTLEQDPACTITHQTDSGPLVAENHSSSKLFLIHKSS